MLNYQNFYWIWTTLEYGNDLFTSVTFFLKQMNKSDLIVKSGKLQV